MAADPQPGVIRGVTLAAERLQQRLHPRPQVGRGPGRDQVVVDHGSLVDPVGEHGDLGRDAPAGQPARDQAYIDSMIGMFLAGGFSIDLTHHALHALGSRLYGFTPEIFDDSQGLDPQALAALVGQMKDSFPHVAELAQAVYHDAASVVGQGCDDQFEFEFALDLLLDGFDRLHQQGWRSAAVR